MSINIQGEMYTGFIDYDRAKLQNKPVDVWIDWLQYRINLILISPLDYFFDRQSPLFKCLNHEDSSTTLAGLTVILCAVDALGAFKAGSSANPGNFRTWIEKYMPKWDTSSPLSNRDIKEWLYDELRCGLAHQLSVKKGGAEWINNIIEEPSAGDIKIDPEAFYTDFKDGVQKYFDDVRNDATTNLKSYFHNRFRSTLINP